MATKTHGMSGTRIYSIWYHMLRRCRDPKVPSYPWYGGKGIKVCKRWQSFEKFLKDMGEPPSKYHTLDRIDNNKNYSPSNCKWATRKEQGLNTKRVHWITYAGKTQCMEDWANELGIPYGRIKYRRRLGWTPEQIFETPSRAERSPHCKNGHPLGGTNLAWGNDVKGKPYPRCRICMRAASKKSYYKKHGRTPREVIKARWNEHERAHI